MTRREATGIAAGTRTAPSNAPPVMRRFIGLVGWLLLCVIARAQDTPYRLPEVYALRGATIVSNTAPPLENGVLVVRNGIIAAIGGSETPIPADAEVIDASGHTVYPGFIDAFASLGMPAQANDPAYASYERGNTHPNAQIRPERQATVLMQPDSAQLARWRRAGFVAAHIAPPHGIMSGQSAVISTGTGTPAELVIVPQIGVVLNLRGHSDAREGINKARVDRVPAGVDDLRIGGDGCLTAAYRRDHAASHHQHAVLDGRRGVGHDFCAAQRVHLGQPIGRILRVCKNA